MANEIVRTDTVPPRLTPVSHAVRTGNLLFCSGTTAGASKIPRDFEKQMRFVMENLKAILEAGGSSMDKVLKTTVFLKRKADFAKMNDIYKSYFKKDEYPARSTVRCDLMRDELLVEIECVAEIDTQTK